jgi:hypothetical protein
MRFANTRRQNSGFPPVGFQKRTAIGLIELDFVKTPFATDGFKRRFTRSLKITGQPTL